MERVKSRVLESVFDAESGEKAFKAITIFFESSFAKTRISWKTWISRYSKDVSAKTTFYLNELYRFGFSASNCIG